MSTSRGRASRLRAPSTKNSSSDYSDSEEERKRGRSRSADSKASACTRKSTETIEANEPGPLLYIVSASSAESKEGIRQRLTEACAADVDLLVFTLDRERNHRIDGIFPTEQEFNELCDTVRSLKPNHHFRVVSNQYGLNIAVFWNDGSVICSHFKPDDFPDYRSANGVHTLRFSLVPANKKDAIDCVIAQIEDSTLRPQRVLQKIWAQLERPCFIGGNLICRDKQATRDSLKTTIKTKDKALAAFEAKNCRWPIPYFFKDMEKTAATDLEVPQNCTLAIRLRGGSPCEQNRPREEEAPVDDSDVDMSDDEQSDVETPATPTLECGDTNAWEALTVGIMRCCCDFDEEKQNRVRELAKEETQKRLLAQAVDEDSQKVSATLNEMRYLEHRIGWNNFGRPRTYYYTLCWWEKCEECKREVQSNNRRYYEEATEDMFAKCLANLAQKKYKAYYEQHRSFAGWRVSDENDGRYQYIKTYWSGGDDDRRRFRAFVGNKIGHKDIPYFIWRHGLPECLRPEIDADTDLDRNTKDVVDWIWKLAEYIVATRRQIDKASHHLRRRQRLVDNGPWDKHLKQ